MGEINSSRFLVIEQNLGEIVTGYIGEKVKWSIGDIVKTESRIVTGSIVEMIIVYRQIVTDSRRDGNRDRHLS